MKDTKIEWADSTWNPVTGCLNDCPYCYARRIATRFALPDGVCFHRDEPEKSQGVVLWNLSDSDTEEPVGIGIEFSKPYIDETGKKAAYPTGFNPTFHSHRLKQPKVWHEPKNIFVCSMADLFGRWVPDEWIEEVFKVCEDAPQHNYLFLTKNPARYIKLAYEGKLPKQKNMWYGITVTNPDSPYVFSGKDTYNMFISIEPILQDMGKWGHGAEERNIKWVIVGAESGNRKEKVTPEKAWIDNLAEECEKHGDVPLFMKDSLIPIVGEENMKREFPAGLKKGEQA